MKSATPFYYRLHSSHDEITVHISRREAQRVLAGLSRQLKKRAQRGVREFFVLHVHNDGRVYSRLSVTHHAAHHRQIVSRLDSIISAAIRQKLTQAKVEEEKLADLRTERELGCGL